MGSFFEKLKKGMGIEIPPEEEEEKPRPLGRKKQSKKLEIHAKSVKSVVEKKEDYNPPTALQPKPTRPKKETHTAKEEIEEKKEKWFEPEGQLAIDVYQTEECLVIQSAIAGVKSENLDISIEEDQVLIKGSREKPSEEEERNYFYQECYWGPFSRQIILPEETDPSRAEAILKEGILTIRIPKIERKKKRKILIRG
jgi:HSP20 family protein